MINTHWYKIHRMSKLWLITWTLLTLLENVTAKCIITKDVTRKKTIVRHPYSRWETIESGPIEYSCSETNMDEIHKYSQLKTNVENIMFISNSTISTLKPNNGSPYYWKNLTELRMSNTNTSDIVPGFFNNFDNLIVLHITDNKIERIIDGVFSPLDKLEELNLSGNSIDALTAHSFSGLLHLETLDLRNNKIESVNGNVLEYQNRLKFVDLSRNRIKSIGNIFSNLSIQTILLSDNELTDFDFGQLKTNPKLISVDISNNYIENMKNVHLVKAELISLSNNHINFFHKSGEVTILNLSHNRIDSLQNVLNPHTKTLILSNNKISNLTENAFDNATMLENLYLDHNNIKIISRETLLGCRKLKYLDISFNNITQIPFGLFNNLKSLTYLDLSNNGMVLDIHTLTTLTDLQILKFQNNMVENFDAHEILKHFKNLTSISLGSNLWTCKQLSQTIHALQSSNISVLSENKTKESNILGISCQENPEFRKETDVEEKHSENNKDQTTDNYYNLVLKYLETIERQISNQSNLHIAKYLIPDYLKDNLTEKYTEELTEIGNQTLNILTQMKNLLIKINSTVEDTAKDLIKTQKQADLQRFFATDTKNETTRNDSSRNIDAVIAPRTDILNKLNPIFTNILLLLIVTCLLALLQNTFSRNMKVSANVEEGVQLM